MSAYVQTVVGSDSPPVGAMMDFAGNVEPSGWLFCFGQSLPRVGVYAQLFQVIGTLYGSVDGSSFSLPDFRGRVRAGKDDMGGVAANRLVSRVNGSLLGASGGAESHTLTAGELAVHTHSYLRQSGVSGGWNFTSGAILATQISDVTGGVTGGSGASHNNVQPTSIVNVIIKYTVSGTVLPIVPGTGDVVGPDGGVADGDLVVFNGASGKVIRGGSLFPRGYIYGLQMANAADTVNDIDIGEGECRDSANLADIKLPVGITKRLDAAWAAGTNQGGLDTGSIANTTYHVHVIKNITTGIVDVLFSESPNSPTFPSGYTIFRRIGSFLRVGATIVQFRQYGDYFALGSVTVYSSTAARASALLFLARTPTGIIVFPVCKARITQGTAGASYFSYGHGLDSGLTMLNGPQQNAANSVNDLCFSNIATNYSAQFYVSVAITGTILEGFIQTLGWYDNRGKDGYSP